MRKLTNAAPVQSATSHTATRSRLPLNSRISVSGEIARIWLSDEREALIDATDVDLVAPYCWAAEISRSSGAYYARGARHGKKIFLHRLILGLEPGDPREGDHIEGNTLDNRREKLRISTVSQNRHNRTFSTNTSGYKGVKRTRRGRFMSVIGTWKTSTWRYLGTFDTAEEAAVAYNNAAREIYGSFASENRV
jgi:hypothetical protein